MEQVFKDRMELYHSHTPVQITDKALPVFQVTEPLLVVFIFGIHPKKGEGLLDFVDVCGTERKLQAQIVFQLFIQQIIRVLCHKVNACVHGTSGTNQLHREGLALCHL